MASLVKLLLAVTLTVMGNLSANAQKTNFTTKTVTTQPYSKIDVTGPMAVFLENGIEGTISISADPENLENIIVASDGETLTISMKNNVSIRKIKNIKITVPIENISELNLKGSGNIQSNEILQSESLAVNIMGSGKIEVSVKSNSIDAKLNGSGFMKLAGNTTELELKTTGSGNFEGKELISENAQVYISGSGDATLFASNTLKARIHGSGSVFYAGKPTSNDVKVMGSGKVKSI